MLVLLFCSNYYQSSQSFSRTNVVPLQKVIFCKIRHGILQKAESRIQLTMTSCVTVSQGQAAPKRIQTHFQIDFPVGNIILFNAVCLFCIIMVSRGLSLHCVLYSILVYFTNVCAYAVPYVDDLHWVLTDDKSTYEKVSYMFVQYNRHKTLSPQTILNFHFKLYKVFIMYIGDTSRHFKSEYISIAVNVL